MYLLVYVRILCIRTYNLYTYVYSINVRILCMYVFSVYLRILCICTYAVYICICIYKTQDVRIRTYIVDSGSLTRKVGPFLPDFMPKMQRMLL